MEKYELKILNDDFENRTKYKITSDQIITLDNGEGRISIALIENTESKKRFVFKYFDAGVSPEILYIEGKELIFLGIQFEIIKIDLKNNELKQIYVSKNLQVSESIGFVLLNMYVKMLKGNEF